MKNKLWENSIALYGVQAVVYLVPLTLLPYLARVLGRVEFGELAFAEAFSNTLSLVLEYGFGLSAARDVAQCRDKPEQRSRILGAVLGAQLGLSLLVALATVAGIAVSGTTAQSTLLPYALIAGVARAVNPLWYFQARERVRAVAIAYILSNISLIVAVFVLVRTPNQAWLALAVKALFLVVSCAFSLVLAYRDTPLIRPLPHEIRQALKSGWPLFLFRGSTLLYSTVNVLILGLIASPSVVAWFAGAEKISRAATGCIMPLVQATYPRINYLIGHDRRGAARAALFAARATACLGFAIGATLWLAAPLLIRVGLGPGFDRSVPVLRILSLLPPLIAINTVFGVQWMLPLKMDREFTTIVFAAGALNVILGLILARSFGEIGMASSVILAEAAAVAGIVATCWYKGAIFSRARRRGPDAEVYAETTAGGALD